MTDTTTAASEPCQAVGAPVEQPVRPDVERVMRAVWDLVRSGPNYDGRQHNVEAAIAAAIDRAVADADREWYGKLEAADAQAARLRKALAVAYGLAPYYISGPYPRDGGWAMCELSTGRVVHRVPGA